MPSSADPGHRILQLLEKQNEPITASFIGFALSEYPFEVITKSLDELCRSGNIKLDFYGYSIIQADNKSPTTPEYPSAVNKLKMAASSKQGHEEHGKKNDQSTKAPGCIEEKTVRSSSPSFSSVEIAFSNKSNSTDKPRISTTLTSDEEESARVIKRCGLTQSHELQEEASPVIDLRMPEPAAGEEFASDAADTVLTNRVDKSPRESNRSSATTEFNLATPNKTIMASLAQDSLDDHLDDFSDIPFIGEPHESIHDDTELLYAKLAGTTIGDGLDQYSDEALIGLSQEETWATSIKHVKSPEDYTPLENHDAGLTLTSSHIKSQIEEEYQELLNMRFIDPDGEEGHDEGSEQEDCRAQEAESKEESSKAPCFTCWTPTTALNLLPRIEGVFSKKSINTIRDLIKAYDSFGCEYGIGPQALRELGNELARHASVMPETVNAEQIRRLCEVSGSRKYVFDVFGLLRSVNYSVPISRPRDGKLATPTNTANSTPRTDAPANSNHYFADDAISQSAMQGAMLALDQCKARHYPIFEDSFLALEPLAALQHMGTDHVPTEYRDCILDTLENTDELEEACAATLLDKIRQDCVLDSTHGLLKDIDVPDTLEWDKAARRAAEEFEWCSYEPESHSLALHHPRLLDWIEASCVDERNKTILRMYLGGQTLEACGQEVGLTRERVRQIISRSLKGTAFVEENRYRYFFETYRPSKADFLAVTSEPIETFIYLQATQHSDQKTPLPFGNALSDKQLSQQIKDGIRRFMDKGYIYADGYRIPAKRDAIITHIVMRHASTRLIKVSNLRELYDQFLDDNGLADDKEYQFSNDRNFEARIDNIEQIIKLPHTAEAKFGGSIRYYDASSMDFAPLTKLLSLGIIEDVECSASILMEHEAFAGVLVELDIHNDYELHYILRKYIRNVPGMDVKRSPIITFGKGNRNDQILEMIKELSPVSGADLAEAYSKRYGIEPSTFLGSYLQAFKIYHQNGKYVYNDQGLSKEQIEFVKGQLEGSERDYVSLSLLKARFKNRFPHASTSLINANNIAQFGYHPSTALLIKDGIDEREMFAKLLDSKQRFAISDDEFGKDVFDNPSFQAELSIRERAYKLIEFEKDRYLASSIFYSQNVAIDETDLKDYVDCAIGFMEPNKPYTVKSLIGSGFRHRIDALRDDFGLDSFFFASLLGTGHVGGKLKQTSIGDTPVFCKTLYNYSAPIMLEQIVTQGEGIEVDDLSLMLEETYGIQASNSLLRNIIKRSGLFFSETLDMVFDSRETYRRKAEEWIS